MNKFKTTHVNGKKVISLNSILETVEYLWQEAGAKSFSLNDFNDLEAIKKLARNPITVEGEVWLNLSDATRYVHAVLIFPTGLLMQELRQTFVGFDQPEIKPVGGFAGLSFNPPGVEETQYFSNGRRKISSLYLTAVSQELFKRGQLDGKTPREHYDLVKKIRLFNKNLRSENFPTLNLEHSYYHLEEATYYLDVKNPKAKHIWMSEDLCLAVAATEHRCIQLRVIDDLNRLQRQLEEQNQRFFVPPSLPAYLPGTLENQYREKGLIEISEARTFGYYPMAQVKSMFIKQGLGTDVDFETKYPWKKRYKTLGVLLLSQGKRVEYTESHTGDKSTSLFPLSVLKEYFTDIDFSSLETPQD